MYSSTLSIQEKEKAEKEAKEKEEQRKEDKAKEKKKEGDKEKRDNDDDDDDEKRENQGLTGEDKAIRQDDDESTVQTLKTHTISDLTVQYTLEGDASFSGVSDKDYEELFYTTKNSIEGYLMDYFEEKFGRTYSAYSDLTLLGTSAPNAPGVIVYYPKVHFYKDSGYNVPPADKLEAEMIDFFSGGNATLVYINDLNEMNVGNPFAKTSSVAYLD